MRSLLILAFLGLFICGAAFGQESDTKTKTVHIRKDLATTQYILNNGMTVVLTPNKDAPLASVDHWVKAGSLHETPGITGIAHLFEHMMFRPLSAGKPDFWAHMNRLGGQANANTRFGSTLFTTTVPNGNLRELLKVESERFRTLKVTDDLLNMERKAVWSEYSTKMDSSPVVDLWDSIYRVGFPKHAYGWFIIGYREDLEKIKAADCNHFFETYYRPNNLGLFISGNFDSAEVMKWVQQYYGGWQRGADAKLPDSYHHDGKYIFGRGKLSASAKNLLAGYRIPEFDGTNHHGLNFVNHVLFDAELSLAKKRLVHQAKMASEATSFNWDYDMGLMKVFLVLLPKVSFDDAISELNKLPDDFSKLTDDEFQAYLNDYRISVAEAALRNEQFNYLAALSWGKQGSLDFVAEAITEPLKLSKVTVLDFIKKHINRANLVVVSNRE